MLICSQSFIIEETKETRISRTRNRTMRNSIAYSLLVKQELQNHQFDILLTAMQLMDADEDMLDAGKEDSRIIDLTRDNQS